MEPHFDLSDDEFEQQFADCTLAPKLFSHEAHLRLAWIHIKRYGIHTAIENIREQIQRFALHHGAKTKYHDTITVSAVRAVYHFMLASQTETFAGFIEENPRLKTEFWSLLITHYNPKLLKSSRARKAYVEPDLLPFDPLPVG